MALKLIPLTDPELDAMRPAMASGFAAGVAGNFDVPRERAEAESARQLDEMLPHGVATDGQELSKAMDGDQRVGFLWISMPGTTYPSMAWISEIEVDAERRSRGHGRGMIAAAEADLAARGVHRIGLHVFGRNEGARRLYERIGYRIFSQLRARPVTAGPDEHPLTLRPMTADDFATRREELIVTDPLALLHDPAATEQRVRKRAGMLAPEGVDSPRVLIRTAHDGDREVGWVWFALPRDEFPTTGVITYLAVDPALRRRGYGRRIVAAAAAELARHRVPKVALSVPGRPDAMAFADSLGMELSSQQMFKNI